MALHNPVADTLRGRRRPSAFGQLGEQFQKPVPQRGSFGSASPNVGAALPSQALANANPMAAFQGGSLPPQALANAAPQAFANAGPFQAPQAFANAGPFQAQQPDIARTLMGRPASFPDPAQQAIGDRGLQDVLSRLRGLFAAR